MANFQSIPLNNITATTERNQQITVRVMRLWCKKTETEPKELRGIELILIDQNGDTIQASINSRLCKIFLEQLNEGETYKIRRFSISSNRVGIDMATFHQCKIWFEYSTKIVPIANATIPQCMYTFYTFNEVFFGAMPDRLYFEIIGKLEHIYPIKISNNGKRRRTIILGNNQNQQLCFFVWGDYIDQMTQIEQEFQNQKKPTLVLLHIKRFVYDGEISIMTTWGATKILVNPDMPEVREFNNSFPIEEESTLGGDENGFHPPILASENIKTLDEIEKLTQGGSYVTMAKFVELDTSGGNWYYNSCKECRSKVKQMDDGLWYCDKKRENKDPCVVKGIGQKTAIPRFQVKFLVTYEDKNLCEMIMWDDPMAEYLGKTAQQILDEDEAFMGIPPPDFRPLIEKEFIVKIRVTKEFNIDQNSSSYEVISICDDARTITKWQSMLSATKVQAMSSSSKETNKTDSMMEKKREINAEESNTISNEVTPQKDFSLDGEAADEASSTKLHEIKVGKTKMI